jgi:hypothetical protein
MTNYQCWHLASGIQCLNLVVSVSRHIVLSWVRNRTFFTWSNGKCYLPNKPPIRKPSRSMLPVGAQCNLGRFGHRYRFPAVMPCVPHGDLAAASAVVALHKIAQPEHKIVPGRHNSGWWIIWRQRLKVCVISAGSQCKCTCFLWCQRWSVEDFLQYFDLKGVNELDNFRIQFGPESVVRFLLQHACLTTSIVDTCKL